MISSLSYFKLALKIAVSSHFMDRFIRTEHSSISASEAADRITFVLGMLTGFNPTPFKGYLKKGVV